MYGENFRFINSYDSIDSNPQYPIYNSSEMATASKVQFKITNAQLHKGRATSAFLELNRK